MTYKYSVYNYLTNERIEGNNLRPIVYAVRSWAREARRYKLASTNCWTINEGHHSVLHIGLGSLFTRWSPEVWMLK